MELRHLRYFITVAEELNFSKAALKLYTAQPSLSQQIKDLEEEIGVRLLNRTKRKVELTEEGAVFLEQARLTLMQAEKAVQMARQIHFRKQQALRIGFITTAEVRVFPKVLPKLRIHSPDIHVELEQLNEQEQHKALKRGDFDIIFSRENLNDDDELTSHVVLKDSLAIMLAQNHPLASLQKIPLEALQQQNFIMLNAPPFAIMNHAISQFLQQNHLELNVQKKTENLVETITAIEDGEGCSILPQYLDPFIKLDHIAVRQLECDLPTLDLYVSYRKHNNNAAVEKFLCVLAQQFDLLLN